ncbi:hypothetical protein BR93DRAFT_568524 [Coniochaeta sp. PMI_546]|nr:hypothetical protein BR93DRAFT_568524 [Coniochaeta sp. PMI_546]
MQLTTGLEYQPQAANELTTTTTTASSFQTRPNPLNLTVAGPIQMDLVVSTAASQPDIRISLPVTTQSAASLDTQQQATAVPSIVVGTRPLHSGNGGGIGSALVLKRQSSASGRRWHPMRSRCHHGSGVPPCSSCLRAGLGSGNR